MRTGSQPPWNVFLWPVLLNSVLLFPGMYLCAYSAAQIQPKTGINGSDLPMFFIGLVLAAWAPLPSLLYALRFLRKRIDLLENTKTAASSSH